MDQSIYYCFYGLIGLTIVAGIIRYFQEQQFNDQLWTEGRDATGTVLEKKVRWVRVGRGGYMAYNVTYEFSVNGRTYQNQQKVGRGTYNELEEGSHVDVRYLPSDPYQARI